MPEKLPELHTFLQSQSREGTLEATSRFTIDHAKAREKRSRFQVSNRSLWLIKLVQAAIAAGAPEIAITFGRRTARVAFTPEQPWEAHEVLDILSQDREPTDPAMRHLVTGLLGACDGWTQTVRWTVGETAVQLDEAGSQIRSVRTKREFLLEATRPARGIRWPALLAAPLHLVVREVLEDFVCVAAHAWTSPIPVRLDGRLLERGYDAVPLGMLHFGIPRRVCKLRRCLAARHLHEPLSRPALPSETPEGDGVTVDTRRLPLFATGGPFLRWRPPNLVPRGVLSLHASMTVAPSVVFLCHGVVVESRLIEPMVARLREANFATRPLLVPRYVFAVSPDELDLSGFAVRGLDHHALVRECLPESLELIDLLEERLSQYKVRALEEMAMIRHGVQALREMMQRMEQPT